MATSAAYIDLTEGSAPATPATGKVRVYAKTDGSAYQKDDAGTETGLAGGGGGAVATDAIWDAAGDLVQGTGSNTGAKVSLGTSGHSLLAGSGTVAWGQPAGTLLGYKADTAGQNTGTPGTTFADVDATNSAVTFTAPASTNVLVRLTAIVSTTTGGAVGDFVCWGLREASSVIAGTHGTTIVHRRQVATATTDPYAGTSLCFVLTGISGGSHTYKWAWSSNNAGATIVHQAVAAAPSVMEVIALP